MRYTKYREIIISKNSIKRKNIKKVDVIMSILAWIILGALAGWIASMIMGENAKMGAIANIVVGVVGAFIGGFLISFFGGQGFTGFNLWSLIVAIIGAIVLLWIVNLFRRKN